MKQWEHTGTMKQRGHKAMGTDRDYSVPPQWSASMDKQSYSKIRNRFSSTRGLPSPLKIILQHKKCFLRKGLKGDVVWWKYHTMWAIPRWWNCTNWKVVFKKALKKENKNNQLWSFLPMKRVYRNARQPG
jgi:hypothetical protein